MKRSYLLYVATGILSFIAFFIAFRLWHADLHIPFTYAFYGDAISPKMREMLNGGWLYWDPRLAAPFGQNTYSLPQLYIINWAIRWVLLEITRSPFMAQNLFDLLSPVLNALAFLYAARRFGLSFQAAIPCAILYGNLFAVYWQIIIAHEYFASFWIVPLACLALVQISDGMRVRRNEAGVVFLVTAVLLGLHSHYEVFFGCALAVAAILIGCLQQRSFEPLRTGRLFIVVTAIAFAFNDAPTILYAIAHHSHFVSYERNAMEAYLYSLSIAQMILPIPFHRVPLLADMRAKFDIVLPLLINENEAATLGLIGTIGLGILCIGVVAQTTWRIPHAVRQGAFLTIAAIALATTGGLGTIFSRFVTPDIRAYNRISPFIAFFCLLAVGYALQACWEYFKKRGWRSAYAVAAVVLTIFGVFDQSPARGAPFAESRERVAVDRAWTDRIAAALPPRSAVLELPYVSYPALPPVVGMQAQLEQVPALYPNSLRLSFGAIEGTPEAKFEKWLALLPALQMITVARDCGFDAVLIYRDGFADRAAALERDLQAGTRVRPLVNDDGTQALYPIAMPAKAADSMSAQRCNAAEHLATLAP